jgi:hypothetical protein
MRIIQTLFVFIFMVLTATTVSAQYGNNGYGGGNGGYGSRNSSMSQMNQHQDQDKPKEIPVEITVSKIMEKLKPELNLDALQEIAVANAYKESIKKQGILLKSEDSQENKIKEFQALSETLDRKVNEFLNEDQKVKYKALKEDNKNPKKSRRNRD